MTVVLNSGFLFSLLSFIKLYQRLLSIQCLFLSVSKTKIQLDQSCLYQIMSDLLNIYVDLSVWQFPVVKKSPLAYFGVWIF